MGDYHVPVLLQQVCTLLEVKPGKRYIDATLGGGSYAANIILQGGEVLGIDQDPDALSACPDLDRLVKVRGNFIHLEEIARQHRWIPVAGVIFDLGVSLHQISTPGRGFSFQLPGPLDMRMDPDLPVTAAVLVNSLDRKHLVRILTDYGQVSRARAMADRIIQARPLNTTTQLAGLIPNPDITRRVFKALRIAINDELGALESTLPQALSVLEPGGRIIVISFHSLEDRIVKKCFTSWEKHHQGRVITRRPVTPDAREILTNPKSKSAKLRLFQKNV
jgi:16S rRNA (cytosine1402-N4)-methyltransferase